MPLSTYTPTAKKVFLNIGLNNNPYSIEQIKQIFNEDFNCTESMKVNSTYKNNVEPTLILKFNTLKSSEYLIEYVLNLCELFKQESIAIKIDSNGLMIYNNSYQGNKIKFNNKYFKTF